MSKREDILDTSRFGSENGIRKGLIYSEILGWIDMGHARGDDIRALMTRFSIGESSGKAYYQVRYEQTMGLSRFATGRFNVWQVKKGRTLTERRGIALAMMMSTAVAFENWQSMSFSVGILTVGSVVKILSLIYLASTGLIFLEHIGELKIVSKASALRRWDHYGSIGRYKNTGFTSFIS